MSKAEIAALREEIDQVRAELGQTIQELAVRVDVPSRVRTAAGRVAERARHSPVPWLVLAGTAAAVAAAVGLAIRANGRRR
jgi:hypothetical protein